MHFLRLGCSSNEIVEAVMANLGFSVPFNDEIETLEEIFKIKKLGDNSIKEVYLSGPQEYSGSGRAVRKLSLKQFTEIVDKIHSEGLRVNLVLNSTCEGSNWYSSDVVREKMGYLKKVHKEHGVEAVTIANPIYIKEVRRQFPDIQICASVLADIDCVERAVVFAKAGANVITPDVNINRNLELLKEIKKATNTELKLMVNEGCLYKCSFRKFHFNFTSHKSKELANTGIQSGVFLANCIRETLTDRSQILKSCWIRPEDTRKYSEITSYFKIVGRSMPRSKVIRCVKAYLAESWDGNLLDLLCASLNNYNKTYSDYIDNKSFDENRFFERITSCDKKCYQCSFCNELAEKLIKLRELTKEEEELESRDLENMVNDLMKGTN
jgi:collagenase-like PrtC family protease